MSRYQRQLDFQPGVPADGGKVKAELDAVALSANNITSEQIVDGTIVNADVNAAAAIDFSKLAPLTSAHILVGSAGNVATDTAVTGDVTIGNTGVTAIANGVIVNADVNASAAIDQTKLDPATLHRSAMYVQSTAGSDALTSNQVIYHGWGYIAGTGSSPSTTIVITLPNSGYDSTAYDVFAQVIGTKNNSNPTTRADVDAANPHNFTTYCATSAQTTTAFQLKIADVDATNIASTRRVLFSWMTIGTKA